MTKKEFLGSKQFKIAFPVIIVTILIEIYQQGHAFGVWLYQVTH